MILTYISDKPSTFQKGKDYFCFEIFYNIKMNRISYRLVDSYGEIAIYENEDFKVKHGSLDNMVFIQNSLENYFIQLKEIQELNELCDDVNGIWGAYYGGDKEVEEKIHAIVMIQAKKEGITLEKVVAV